MAWKRAPYLDVRLVQFAAAAEVEAETIVPKEVSLAGRSMAGRLPPRIVRRRKAGFNIPNARWIKGEMKAFVEDCLSRRR